MWTRLIKAHRVAAVLFIAGGCLVNTNTASAQTLTIPPGGRNLLPEDVDSVTNGGKNDNGESLVAPIEGENFKSVIRGVVTKKGNPWDVETRVQINMPLAKDEAVLIHFRARTIQTNDESGQGLLTVSIGETSPPWLAQFTREFGVRTEWQDFYLNGRIQKNYDTGKLALKLSFGQSVQTIEVGGVEILSYGQRDIKTLPYTRSTYAGRELNAAWRVEAEKRIQELRTAPFSVQVVDIKGKPVSNASVRIELKKHSFLFGAAVNPASLVNDDKPENAVFRQRFLELFNAGSFINSLKWEPWSGEWGSELGRDTTMRGLEWMRKNDMPVRGHVLVWPSFRFMPNYIKELEGKASPEEIQRLVLAHIDEITAAAEPYIEEWDVVNEPRDNHDLMDLSGKQVMVDYFRRARNRLPNAKLVLNDYSILSPLTESKSQKDYEEIARYLIDSGAPIDGLGFQGHFGAEVPSPMRMLKVLDHFSALGRTIRVTEFDMQGDDDALKADFLRDLLTVLYSHASVTGFQMWGMEQAVRPDGTLTPLGEAFRKQIHEQWNTDVKATTNANAVVNGRGFLGRYEVTVIQGERNVKVPFELRKDSAPLIVTLT